MTPERVAEEFCPVIHTTVEEVEREVAKYAQHRRLSPEEIGALAQRMVDCTDPVKKDELCEEIVRGWYGRVKDAYAPATAAGESGPASRPASPGIEKSPCIEM